MNAPAMLRMTAAGTTALAPILALLIVLLPIDRANAQAEAADTFSITVGEDWAYISFDAPGEPLEVADPAESGTWHIGFYGTDVLLNGGSAGPGGLTAYCICQNRDAGPETIQALTPESARAAFDGVTLADAPADANAWSPRAFAADRWYRYNLAGQHLIWPTYDVYLVRRGDDTYKFQVTGYYGPAGEPRHLSYRVQRLTG